MTPIESDRDNLLQATAQRVITAPPSNGLNNATVFIFQRAATNNAPALPSAAITYTFGSSALPGLNNGWSSVVPPADPAKPFLFMSQALASSVEPAVSLLPAGWSAGQLQAQDGLNGGPGLSSAIVYVYQRKAGAAPTLGPGAVTYDLATKTITTTTLANNWQKTLPAGSDPLYVMAGTASSTGSTDTIEANEWSGVVLLAASGANGAAGLNSAVLTIFQRSVTPTPLAKPSAECVYTFASGTLTGLNNGWSSQLPPADAAKPYLQACTATAAAITATDTVPASEWSAPVVHVRDGADGGVSLARPMEDTSVWGGYGMSLVTVADGKVGPQVWRSATGGGPDRVLTHNKFFQIDRTRSYRVRFWARASADATGVLYHCLHQFKADGTNDGLANAGRAPYKPSGVGKHTEWREYDYLWTPADFQAGVTQVRPDFLMNYAGSVGYWEVQGYHWFDATELSNAGVTRLIPNANMKVTGTTLTKVLSEFTWDGGVYSQDSYAGGAYASAIAVTNYHQLMFGLNSLGSPPDLVDSNYPSLDFALYLTANGQLHVYESNVHKGQIGNYVADDFLAVTFDGINVRYIRNGDVLRTTLADQVSQPLFFDCSFYDVGSSLKNVMFGPMSNNSWASVGGTGKPQDNANYTTPSKGDAINEDPALENIDNCWTRSTAVAIGYNTTAVGAAGGTYFQVASYLDGDATVYTKKAHVVDPNKTYSLYANLYAATGNNRNIYVYVDFYDAAGAWVGTSWGGTKSGYTYGGQPSTGQFTKCGGDFGANTGQPIPANVKTAKIGVWFQYSGGGTSGVEQAAQDIRLTEVTAVRLAKSQADAANAAIVKISDDNWLTKGEKPEIILKWNTIVGEMPGLRDHADAIGVSRTAYINAYNALGAYLPVSWNDLTVDTAIVGTTFRDTFKAYYDAKQALIVALNAKAGTTANTDGSVRTPGGGYRASTASLETGAVKIRLPQSWTDTMLKFSVDIYEYVTGYSCKLEISGYNSSGPRWYNCSATVVGGNVEYPVRFGHDGTKCCVWIGNPNEQWAYPQVRVQDVLMGYTQTSKTLWQDGWQISVDSVGAINVTGEILDTLPGADWSKSARRPANLAALAGDENINNAGITLSTTGVLVGAGGGRIETIAVRDGDRSSNRPPSWYPVGTTKEFKESAAVGLGGYDNYLTLETIIQYADASGGACYQYAYRGTTTWRRYGTAGASSWAGPWVQDLDRNAYTGDLNASSDVTLIGRGVTLNGNTVLKTGGSAATWDSDAYSMDSYVGGAYVSAVPMQTNGYIMFGLNSDPTTDSSYAGIDYALYTLGDGSAGIRAYVSGADLGGIGTYATGDVLSVTYDGTYVRWLKNGVVLFSLAAAILKPLYFDSSLHTMNTGLKNVRFGPMSASVEVPFIAASTAAIQGNNIGKVSGNGGSWDSNVYSKNGFIGGAHARAVVVATNNQMMFGLNTIGDLTSPSYDTLNYAFYLATGNLRAYESNVSIDLGVTYAVGDVLDIVYDGSNVRYMKNGSLLRTVTVTITEPIYFDSSFLEIGTALKGVYFGPLSSNNWNSVGGAGKPANNATANITLIGRGIEVQGNFLKKTLQSSAWDADAYSKESAPYAFASATITDLSTAVFFGLNDDPTASTYWNGIFVNFHMEGNGYAYTGINEALTNIFTVAVGDVLLITYDGVNVRWYKNGSLLRAWAYDLGGVPLYFDSSFASIGGTLGSCQFGPFPSALWSHTGGAGKPADNATVGAPTGTYVGNTPAQTVEQRANGALQGGSGPSVTISNNLAASKPNTSVNVAMGTATVTISGGTAPYTISWAASNVYCDPDLNGGSVVLSYADTATVSVAGKAPSNTRLLYTLTVTVIDANKLSTSMNLTKSCQFGSTL
jgi:hypothetical protein